MTILTALPDLVPADIGTAKDELADVYVDYTKTVSPDNMAVSLLTATYLLFLCRTLKARHVADFGSGFTSYVLARYAAETDGPVTVTSVDDDREWLERTGTFLDRYGLRTNLTMWDDWQDTKIRHDVGCYDLSRGDIRDAGMEQVARRTRPRGVVVLDDAHHEGHRETMRKVSKRLRWDLYGLQDYTTDHHHRFAALLVRP